MRTMVVCPKCQREARPGDPACARCGLLVSRWEGFIYERPVLQPVDEAWKRLEINWEDDRAHRQFLELAVSVDGLDVAAAHYQEARRARPDDSRASEGVRRSVALAQSVYTARSQAERTRSTSGWATGGLRVGGLLGAIVVVLAFIGILQFLWRSR
jgi:hypothetical protein